MKILVKVKASAKQGKVEKIDDTHFVVSVKEPPVEGQANFAVVAAVASYLGLRRDQVRIVSGQTRRQKVMEIRN